MIALVIDTETTGLAEPVIPVEVAWCSVSLPDVSAEERFRQYFQPGKAIEFGAMSTHHITPDMLEGTVAFSTFALPEATQYIIGHNVDYDWKALGKPNVKRIDTLAFCRKLWPEMDSHKLGAMIYKLDPDNAKARLQGAHGAAVDVELCRFVLQAILAKLEVRPDTWEGLWTLCERARIPDVISFGKHKGAKIKDIPSDYKAWMLRQPDMDPYLIAAIRGQATLQAR